MKAAMIFPTRESEKAISGYSVTLTENIRKAGQEIDDFTYEAGNSKTLFSKISQLKKYDIVHIQHEYNLLGGFGLPFFILYFYLWINKIKTITTMHTVLSQREKFKSGPIKTFLRKVLYQIQNRVIGNVSERVILHADFFKKILSEEYKVSKRKIVIIPQGIIEDIPKYNKNIIKKELGLSGPVYLFIGSMIPDHGHDIIINQADKIGKTILVVANPGSVNDRNSDRTRNYLEQNQDYVLKNKLFKFVRFDISDINDKNPQWWKYFVASDLVLLPYRGGIGSGIFAHSIAAKIPVIASNIQYFNEISKNYGCLRTAKKDSNYPNIIKEAMKPQNYKKMVKESERYLKENGLSVIGKKYKKIYSGLK
ncbi:MAG: glycosyltransferase [archaeon]|nr:glycosyltransferase [archaeon]MCR4323976.1 glycosyltransferase [Nanoarchaeota archaeon]